MEKKTFDPEKWLSNNPEKQKANQQNEKTESSLLVSIEEVIRLIEENQQDITSVYSEWCNIGFAFAREFGEQGREWFHRISRFHPEYSTEECNKKYDSCLKDGRGLVTLKTFFFYAKNAGLTFNAPPKETEDTDEPIYMPQIPITLFSRFPTFLQKAVKVATFDEEKDLILLGALGAISSCIPNVYGIYDGRKVFSNLYVFITAPASAGKGRLVHCRQLVWPVHDELRQQASMIRKQFEMALVEYNLKKGTNEHVEKPQKPAEKLLFIPANNSSTGAYQLLGDSDGRGLIFETEGDTLANAFKSDYGNYSDGFRKAFHHETISYYRRMDREYVDIPHPCLSTVLSGTPKQIRALIPNTENGLFSRFIFYNMNFKPEWRNVFEEKHGNGLEDYFDNLGQEFYGLYKKLNAGPERMFCLQGGQEEQFNLFFTRAQEHFMDLLGLDYLATIRRLGLITFRICMIFSVLRLLERKNDDAVIYCSEEDFQAALSITTILNQHAVRTFTDTVPQEETPPPLTLSRRKQVFFEKLPEKFSRQDYLKVASSLSIHDKAAEHLIISFVKKRLIAHVSRSQYQKVEFK